MDSFEGEQDSMEVMDFIEKLEDQGLPIPAIPEGRMKFGDPDWIAVEHAYAEISDFLDLSWGLTKRRAVLKSGKLTVPAYCIVCALLVENGDHYNRGHGLWCHLECYEKAQKFVRKINEIAPSVYRRPLVKA